MLIAAAMLAATLQTTVAAEIDLSVLFRTTAVTGSRGATCGIKVVGYRFVGKAGQQFRYAGDTYEIPAEGAVELIADRGTASYRVGGQSVAIAEGPLDQFGFREVALP